MHPDLRAPLSAPMPPWPLPWQCMVTKCGGQIFRCVTDTSCKAALDCLQTCEFNDQVGPLGQEGHGKV